jgi:hypothetical protein
LKPAYLYTIGIQEERIMKRFAIAALVIIALFLTGCTGPATNGTLPSKTATGTTVTTPAPMITQVPTTPGNPAPNTTNITMNGTNTGNVSISPGNDQFLISPVNAQYYEGDNVTIHGTTILAAGDPLLVEVVSSSFGPTPKTSSQAFTGVSGVVSVIQGPPGGPNTWSFSFSTDGYNPDVYIVTVSGLTVNVEDSTSFELLPRTT